MCPLFCGEICFLHFVDHQTLVWMYWSVHNDTALHTTVRQHNAFHSSILDRCSVVHVGCVSSMQGYQMLSCSLHIVGDRAFVLSLFDPMIGSSLAMPLGSILFHSYTCRKWQDAMWFFFVLRVGPRCHVHVSFYEELHTFVMHERTSSGLLSNSASLPCSLCM